MIQAAGDSHRPPATIVRVGVRMPSGSMAIRGISRHCHRQRTDLAACEQPLHPVVVAAQMSSSR